MGMGMGMGRPKRAPFLFPSGAVKSIPGPHSHSHSHSPMKARFAVLAAALAFAVPAHAQTFMGDVHQDLNQVQKKFIDLANAIPESAYGYHPTGARTIGEVLLHVAADNYYIPGALGTPAPATTGITSDYKTSTTFEKRKLTKAQVIADLTASFQHLHRSLPSTDTNLNDKVKFFGSDIARRTAILGTVADLHEHLGQLIAYARANNVVPPWSK